MAQNNQGGRSGGEGTSDRPRDEEGRFTREESGENGSGQDRGGRAFAAMERAGSSLGSSN